MSEMNQTAEYGAAYSPPQAEAVVADGAESAEGEQKKWGQVYARGGYAGADAQPVTQAAAAPTTQGYAGGAAPGYQDGNAGEIPMGSQYRFAGEDAPGMSQSFTPESGQHYARQAVGVPQGMQYAYAETMASGAQGPAAQAGSAPSNTAGGEGASTESCACGGADSGTETAPRPTAVQDPVQGQYGQAYAFGPQPIMPQWQGAPSAPQAPGMSPVQQEAAYGQQPFMPQSGQPLTHGNYAAPPVPQQAMPYGPQQFMGHGQQAAMYGPQAMPQTPQQGFMYGPQPTAPQQSMMYGPQPVMMQGPQPGMEASSHGHRKGSCSGHAAHPGAGEAGGATAGAYSYGHEAQGEHAGAFDPFGFGAMFGSGPGGFGGHSGTEDPREMERRFGQMMELYSDFTQGKTDPSKILNFLTSTGTYFWKGAIVGALLTFILTNASVKSALGDALSGLFGSSKNTPAE